MPAAKNFTFTFDVEGYVNNQFNGELYPFNANFWLFIIKNLLVFIEIDSKTTFTETNLCTRFVHTFFGLKRDLIVELTEICLLEKNILTYFNIFLDYPLNRP